MALTLPELVPPPLSIDNQPVNSLRKIRQPVVWLAHFRPTLSWSDADWYRFEPSLSRDTSARWLYITQTVFDP
jgi:hypothetical protein